MRPELGAVVVKYSDAAYDLTSCRSPEEQYDAQGRDVLLLINLAASPQTFIRGSRPQGRLAPPQTEHILKTSASAEMPTLLRPSSMVTVNGRGGRLFA